MSYTSEDANKLAERLGTVIPGSTPMTFWPIPLLEKIVEELEEVKRRLEGIE